MTDTEQFPSIQFKSRANCIVCGKLYESQLEMTRLDVPKRKDYLLKKRFDEANVEIAKIQGKYLGHLVCKEPSQCYSSTKKL